MLKLFEKLKMDTKKKEIICPLGTGIIINKTQVRDPNDNIIYNKDCWWGLILLGDNNAWEEWWEY